MDPSVIHLSVPKKIGYTLLTLGLLAVGAELSARTVAWATGRGFGESPEFRFTSPFFTSSWPPQPEIEQAGLRFHGRTIAREKPAGEVRVLCFGGSTTVNVRGGNSWARILERRLNDSAGPNEDGLQSTTRPDHTEDLGAPSFKVLRAASNAYSSAHSLVNLSLRALAADPDVVILYHNENDSSVNRMGRWTTPDYANKYLSPLYLGLRHRSGFLNGIRRSSRLYRFVEKSFLQWEAQADPRPAGGDLLDGLPYFRRNLVSFVAVARAHGVRVLLATQPARSEHRVREDFVAYNDAIRAVAAERDVPLADVAALITDDEFFSDRVHYRSKGLEAVADAMEEPLRGILATLE